MEIRIAPRSSSVQVRLERGQQSAASSARPAWTLHLHLRGVLALASRSDFLHSSGKEPQFTAAAWILLPVRAADKTQPPPGTSSEESSLVLELAASGHQLQAVQG